MQSDLVVFLHIPKTGGISFRRMLKAKVLLENLTGLPGRRTMLGFYDIPSYVDRLEHVQNLDDEQRARIKYFEGHYGYGVHEILQRECAYVTLLRDPVERTISNYFHLQQDDVIERDGVPRVPLPELLLMGKAWMGTFFFDNCQVRYLAGESGRPLSVPFGGVGEADLDIAKKRLADQFLFAGLTERFDESAVLLMDALRWRWAFYVRTNVNPDRLAASEISNEALDLIRLHNQLDIQLYDFAASLMESVVSASGSSLNERVRSFKRRNEALARVAGPLGLAGASYRRQRKAKRDGRAGL